MKNEARFERAGFKAQARGVSGMLVAISLALAVLLPVSAPADPPSNAFRYVHDQDGRLKAAIDPEGDTALYNWDAAGNLLSISRHASSQLSIIKLEPPQGEVGTTVEIKGTGFSSTPGSNTVKFNGTAATVEAATSWSLKVKVPTGATSGAVTVATSGEPVTSPENFTLTASAKPSISSISPTLAAGGEEVTISGSNFDSSPFENVVTFNGIQPELVSAASSSIKFKVPADRLGGRVSVTTSGGLSTGPDLFVPPTGVSTAKVGTTSRLSLGNVKTAEFAGSEKVALTLFDGNAGENASLSLSEATIGGSISIWGPNGAQLSGGSANFSGGGGSVFVGPVALPTTGTYTILLTPSGSGTGSVKLTTYGFSDLSGTLDPPASAEGLKQTVSIGTPGQVARYAVEMKAGDKVSLRTSSSNFSGGGYYVKWLNSKGETAYSTWFGAKENAFWDTKTFTSAGTYTLLVDPEFAATGSVDLTLWETPDLTGQTITPSTEGGSVTSTTSIPGQRELVTFSGTKDQRVSWLPSQSTISAGGTITLLRPNGAELGNGSFTAFREPLTLPETGTYTFVIDPAATGTGAVTNGTGSIKLSAYLVSDLSGTLDPPASAEGLKQTVSIGTPGQVARYAVEMKAGDKVSLRTSSSNFSGGGYYVKWLNSKGETAYSTWFGAKENAFWDTKTFTSAGTYTLLVDPEFAATGSVDLTLWETPDLTGQTITPSTEGGSVTSTTSIPGQRELVTFSGTKDQRVSWLPSQSTISAGGTITLLRPNGAELGNGSFTAFREPLTLPETGTYTFVIDPAATGTGAVTNGTGSIKLSAYLVSDLSGTLDPPASAEGLKQTVSIGTPGQVARYAVEMKAGDKVSLRTSSSNFSGGGYYVKWLNSKGETAYSTWFGAKENAFWDTKTFTSAGTYTLLVDPEFAATGSVDLTLWETPDLTGQTITPSTEGGSVTSTTSIPGQRELVTFSGTASQLITLKGQESTITSGAMWLLKPDGTQLSGSEVTFTSSSSGKKELTLPSTGTYTIVVDPPATGTNPVTNGTGSVKVIVYLGSHVAWWGPQAAELQLVRFVPFDGQGGGARPIAYSDVPSGSRSSSAEPRKHRRRGVHHARHKSKKPGRRSARRGKLAQVRSNSSESDQPARSGPLSGLLPQSWSPAKKGSWLPPRPDQERNWLVGRSSSPWLDVAPLEAASSETTTLVGQALKVDGLPVADLVVSIEGSSASARTDSAGRFLLEDVPAGHQVLRVGGESVPGSERYGTYEIGVDLAAGERTALDYTIWLTPLDEAGDLVVDSPTKGEVSLNTPRVPGLEVKIPGGTTITDDNGNAVKHLNITAIPLDRPPFPLPPFVTVPVYFTVQPGGASLSKGARFIYPNWGELAPGERVDFWNYDPDDRGWYVYGRGTVTPDGEQVVPDPGVRVWEFTGAMAVSGPTPPGTGPLMHGASGGDPVDLYTGLFTYHRTDLVLPDVIPISIERTYRPNDSNSYSFGEGTTSLYDLRLWPIVNYKEADLILPDGGRVHYVRTSPGTSWAEAVYEPIGASGSFDGSTISWNGSGWDMKLTNGMTLTFGGFAPLVAIKDRFGNTLTIKRTGGQTGNIKEIVSPSGRWAKFTYDASNRITEIADNGGRKLKYTYTSGRLTKVEAPAGRTTEYEYDASGRMKAVINARGNKYLQNEYDANGRVKKQTMGDGGTFEFAYELNEAGKVKSATVTDPRGYQRKVSFSSEGFPTSDTEALGTETAQTTSFERQPETGLVLFTTDPLGRKTEFEYDSVSNITEVTRLADTEDAVTTKFAYQAGTADVTKITDPLGHSTSFKYGARRELQTRTDPLSNQTTFSYNADGRITALKDPEGGETKFGYANGDLASITDPLGRTTSRFTDGLGRVRSVTSPSGQRTVLAYDEADRLTSITSPSGAETTIGYDKDGDVTSVTDPREGQTTATYDSMDRLATETNPLEKTASRSYDKAGNLIEATSRSGEVSKFSYDEFGRLAKAQLRCRRGSRREHD